jgi:uncharacterized membrane protein YesL
MNKIFNLDSKPMQLMNKFADIMFLNVITLICCIPIITIGPATTAMHYVLLKMFRNECDGIIKNYFKSFKENFKQGIFLGLIYTVIAVILFVDVWYMLNVEEIYLIFEIIIVVACVLVLFSYVWVYPLQCRYENPIPMTIKNSFKVGLLNLGNTIMMILISLIPLMLLASFDWAVPVVTLLGIALPGYWQAMLYSRVFDRLEGVERTLEGEIIDDGWRMDEEAPIDDCLLQEAESEALPEVSAAEEETKAK